EHVYALIEENPAAAHVGIVAPRFGIAVAAVLPVHAAQRQHLPERTRIDQRLRIGDAGVVPVVEAEDERRAAVALLRIAYALDVGERAAGRLLAEHVALAIERIDGDLGNQVVRRAGENDVEIGFDERLPRRIHRRAQRADPVRARGI